MRETKQVIVVRTDLDMPVGKIAAQVAHASGAFLTTDRRLYNCDLLSSKGHKLKRLVRYFEGEFGDEVEQWVANDYTKICVGISSEEEICYLYDKAKDLGMEAHLIIDNGRTCFGNVKTITCLGLGPHYLSKFDGVTDHLKLLR